MRLAVLLGFLDLSLRLRPHAHHHPFVVVFVAVLDFSWVGLLALDLLVVVVMPWQVMPWQVMPWQVMPWQRGLHRALHKEYWQIHLRKLLGSLRQGLLLAASLLLAATWRLLLAASWR